MLVVANVLVGNVKKVEIRSSVLVGSQAGPPSFTSSAVCTHAKPHMRHASDSSVPGVQKGTQHIFSMLADKCGNFDIGYH
jgi:hypothetical protein